MRGDRLFSARLVLLLRGTDQHAANSLEGQRHSTLRPIFRSVGAHQHEQLQMSVSRSLEGLHGIFDFEHHRYFHLEFELNAMAAIGLQAAENEKSRASPRRPVRLDHKQKMAVTSARSLLWAPDRVPVALPAVSVVVAVPIVGVDSSANVTVAPSPGAVLDTILGGVPACGLFGVSADAGTAISRAIVANPAAAGPCCARLIWNSSKLGRPMGPLEWQYGKNEP